MVAAQKRTRPGQVAGRDSAADLRAADLLAVGEERRHDRDRETLALAQGRQRLRRSAALEAECRIGRHDETGDLDTLADRRHEGVVRGDAESMVEMLDDGHLHAGSLEADETLVGIAQQRRRQAFDQLLGMGVESDHRRPCPRPLGRAPQLAEQVQMAAMQAIEDADRQIEPAEVGRRAPMPGTTAMRLPGSTTRSRGSVA